MHFSTDYPFSARAAIYGDGCFTTMCIEGGHPQLLHEHIARLQRGCERLDIVVQPGDWDELTSLIRKTATGAVTGIIKVIISAGNGGRGYQRSTNSVAQCYLQVLPPVSHYTSWRRDGIDLAVSETKLAINPAMAGIKHLNRIEQVLVKQTCGKRFQDSLVLDDEQMIVEVSAGNLFWKSLGRWFTPDLTMAGVEGVMRNHLMAVFAANQVQVSAVRCKISVIKHVSDMFICNSLMGVVPVNSVQLHYENITRFDNQRIAQVAGWLGSSLHCGFTEEKAVL